MRHSQPKRHRYHTERNYNTHYNPFRSRRVEDSLRIHVSSQKIENKNHQNYSRKTTDKPLSKSSTSLCSRNRNCKLVIHPSSSRPHNPDQGCSSHSNVEDLRHKLKSTSKSPCNPSNQQTTPISAIETNSFQAANQDDSSNGFKVDVTIGTKTLRAMVNMRRKSSIINRTVIKLIEEKSNPINYDTIMVKMSVGSK